MRWTTSFFEFRQVVCLWMVLFFLQKTEVQSQNLNCHVHFRRPTAALNGCAEVCILRREADEALLVPKFHRESLALVTHGSPDRFDRIKDQCSRWNGTCVAALYFENNKGLDTLSLTSQFPANAVLLLVIGTSMNGAYPINLLRNLGAWLSSVLDLSTILLLDADALPAFSVQSLSTYIERTHAGNGMLDEKSLLVIPAFDCFDCDLSQSLKESAIQQLHEKKLQPMHSPRPSYKINVNEWILARQSYKTPYHLMAEHYAVGTTSTWSVYHPFAEAFVGRGFNKQANHFELWASGFDYYFCSDHFILNLENINKRSERTLPSMIHQWRRFRHSIATIYDLTCRQAMWRLCDERGLHCDRVCSKGVDDELQIHSFEQDEPENPNPTAASHSPHSWRAFETEANANLPILNPKPFSIDRQSCLGHVDVVFTWVNGSEEDHRAERAKFIPQNAFQKPYKIGLSSLKDHNLEFRFRDFGVNASTLKYAIRSILLNANWVSRIHVVIADGQTPPRFLNLSHPRLNIVRHSSIMRRDCLPSFNSCAIESSIHKIPGLAPCFIYLNDDIMLASKVEFDHFWAPQSPFPFAMFNGDEVNRRTKDEWQVKLRNVEAFLKKEFHLSKVFLIGHVGHFFVKSEIFKLLQESESLRIEMERTECEQWRTANSFWLPMIYQNVLQSTYHSPVKLEAETYHVLADFDTVRLLRNALVRAKSGFSHWLCLNDMLGANISIDFLQTLQSELEWLFPRQDLSKEEDSLFLYE